MELFKESSTDIILDNSKEHYSDEYATYRVEVSEFLNKALIEYQAKEGFSKTRAVEVLIIKALQELGLLPLYEKPITPLSNLGVGRKSSNDGGSIAISGKTSLKTYNAIMSFKSSHESRRRDTKGVLIQKLLLIGLESKI